MDERARNREELLEDGGVEVKDEMQDDLVDVSMNDINDTARLDAEKIVQEEGHDGKMKGKESYASMAARNPGMIGKLGVMCHDLTLLAL
ncbi:hypothetical protein V6N13_095542 [Hibiscus sabdariffa]|uniref:Uncharacterized protein n=2 Tax=Hibiscus sabdariffa TaxID=183260 RepID=A0ABR2PRC1_9ROSI